MVTRKDLPVDPAKFAGAVLDDVLDAVVSRDVDGDDWAGPVVVSRCGSLVAYVGVVDLELSRVGDPAASATDLFPELPSLVQAFAAAHDAERRGFRSLRLVVPATAVAGGKRPHVEPGSPFRASWLVGAPHVDQVVRLLWRHGRDLLRLLTPAVVVERVPGRPKKRFEPATRDLVRWCRRNDAVVGFGGVDVGAWALGGVRDAVGLASAGERDSATREVVELVATTLGGGHRARR